MDPFSGLLALLGATFSALHQHGVELVTDQQVQRSRWRGLTRPDRLRGQATAELAALRRTDFVGLSDEDWAVVGDAAVESLRAARILELAGSSPGLLVNAGMLQSRVRSAGRDVMSSFALGEDTTAAYQRLLEQCCHKIARLARTVDAISRAARTEMSTDAAGTDVRS